MIVSKPTRSNWTSPGMMVADLRTRLLAEVMVPQMSWSSLDVDGRWGRVTGVQIVRLVLELACSVSTMPWFLQLLDDVCVPRRRPCRSRQDL